MNLDVVIELFMIKILKNVSISVNMAPMKIVILREFLTNKGNFTL